MKKSQNTPNAKTAELPRSAETMNDPRIVSSHEDIELLAYELWLQRGAPDGAPEQDWYTAEEILKSRSVGAA